VVPDLTTCSILINAFGRAREWDKVDLVLAEMGTYGIKADLISVYGKAGLFYEVEIVVKSLRAEIARHEELGNSSLAFDLVTYNTLLDVYGKAGRLNDVIYWFAEMKKAGVQPDVLTFNSLVNAYGKASHYDGVCPVSLPKSWFLLYCHILLNCSGLA
jgi:pentatricopeptide repeat protein